MRRFGTLFVVVMMVALAASTAAAQDKPVIPADSRVAPEGLSAPVWAAQTRAGELLSESFEVAVPPTGWTEVIFNAAENWKQDPNTALDGTYSATVHYDPALAAQDEWLITPQLAIDTLTAPELSFWASASEYWACTMGNYTARAYVSTGGNTPADFLAGTMVYDFCTDGPPGAFIWHQFIYDLSAFQGVKAPVYVGFHYAGTDGAAYYVDLVQVGEPVPAPDPAPAPGSTCATATPLLSSWMTGTGFPVGGETADGASGVGLASCSFASTQGGDVWYMFTPTAAGTATITTCGSSFDSILDVFSGACGALTEVACNDDSCGLQSEVIDVPITNARATYYIRIQQYNTDPISAGNTLDFYFHSTVPVPVDLQAFDVE